MSIVENVNEALQPISAYHERHGAVAVTTTCMYPSNALVTVFVRGGMSGAVVSDDGQAIDELTALNRDIPDADKFLHRFCVRSGMKSDKGVIFSPRIEWRQLLAAIAFVANTSVVAVTAGLQTLKKRPSRNLRKELEHVLYQSFPEDRIKKDFRVVGHSTRSYSFNAVHVNTRILIMDPVGPEANSVNSRAIAHFDVGRKNDDTIIQRLVYDDELRWKAADLNLLQSAAKVVPFSNLGPAMQEFAIE
jgi:hypothetical protein